jgi:hypothetical protein
MRSLPSYARAAGIRRLLSPQRRGAAPAVARPAPHLRHLAPGGRRRAAHRPGDRRPFSAGRDDEHLRPRLPGREACRSSSAERPARLRGQQLMYDMDVQRAIGADPDWAGEEAAGQEGWPGAGSNRRPSDFQARLIPALSAVQRPGRRRACPRVHHRSAENRWEGGRIAMRSEPGQRLGDLAVATLDGVKVALCGGRSRVVWDDPVAGVLVPAPAASGAVALIEGALLLARVSGQPSHLTHAKHAARALLAAPAAHHAS